MLQYVCLLLRNFARQTKKKRYKTHRQNKSHEKKKQIKHIKHINQQTKKKQTHKNKKKQRIQQLKTLETIIWQQLNATIRRDKAKMEKKKYEKLHAMYQHFIENNYSNNNNNQSISYQRDLSSPQQQQQQQQQQQEPTPELRAGHVFDIDDDNTWNMLNEANMNKNDTDVTELLIELNEVAIYRTLYKRAVRVRLLQRVGYIGAIVLLALCMIVILLAAVTAMATKIANLSFVKTTTFYEWGVPNLLLFVGFANQVCFFFFVFFLFLFLFWFDCICWVCQCVFLIFFCVFCV